MKTTGGGFMLMLMLILGSCSVNQAFISSGEEGSTASQPAKWVFTANSSTPRFGNMGGMLTGTNEVRFTGDSLVVYLPYFGRAYNGAGAYNTRGPLDFTSTKFSVSREAKKNGQVLTIEPKDNPEIQSMMFSLYDNGSAQLNVTLTNRSPISFNGTVASK